MKVAIVALSLGLALAPDAGAGDRKTEEILLIVSGAADIVSTEIWLQHEGAAEAHPLMRGSLGKRIAMTSLSTVGVAFFARALENSGHDKAARVLRWGVISARFGAAGWNVNLSIQF